MRCSQKLWPTWLLELPMPFGCCDDLERSSRRADSSVLAATTTTFAFASSDLCVWLSTNATPLALPVFLSTSDLVRGGVRAEREIARVHRGIDQSRRRIERGVDVAAAGPAPAGAAAEALAAVLVLHAVGRDAGAVRRGDASHRLERLAQLDLARVHLVRALEEAVRQVRQPFLVAGDAEVGVDAVVVRLDVGVGDRPVLAVAVVRLRLEVVVGEAQREAPPDVRLAAEHARAHPGVVGAGVRVLLLVDEDVLHVVRAAPSADVRPDVLVRAVLRGVGWLADVVLVEREGMPPGRRVAAARMVVRPLHRAQLGFDVDLLACLEEQDLEAVRREHVRGHATRGARPDDDGVVGLGEVDLGGLGGRGENDRHCR